MGFYSKHIFPRLLDWSLGNRTVARERRLALAQSEGRVLEVGFGTGLNLPHYPEGVAELTALEPERMLAKRVARRIAGARFVVKQQRLDASLRLPFEDGSFDWVVTTFTVCTIEDVAAALAEMRRVLKAEGRYSFLEHGRSDDARVAKRQDRFNPIQKKIGCGCNVNRPIDRLIREAGFEIVELHRYLMPATPRIFAEMYRGIAKR